ncbi:MAG: hypothetical protein ACRCZP_15860, partial [Phycicoccus sp.]
MTATAIDASTGGRGLPMPSHGEVLALQAVRDYPAVSLLCSTTPAPTMTTEDRSRLARLAADASRRVEEELGRSAGQPLRTRLEDIVEDAAGRPTRSGVAVFVAHGHESAWALALPVLDRAVVDPTFATRDLVRSLHRTPHHVVLLLTETEARLFDGVGDHLLPPFSGPFPMTAGSPAGRRSRERSEERRGEPFLREVDRALGTYLSVHPAPLVLVGASRTVSTFTGLSRNLGRLAGVVRGSHVRTALPAVAAKVRPVLEAYLRSREVEALALLEQRAGAGTVATGMPAVWLAARVERPE